MAGLLDFLDTPDGQLGIGLLAAAGPSMSPMGFGQRLAQGLQYAKEQQRAANEAAWLKLQQDRQRQAWSREDQIAQLAPQFFRPGKAAVPAISGGSVTGQNDGILPSAGQPAVAPKFDMQGYAQAVMGIDPAKGLPMLAALQKETPFDKIDPKAFTPQSLAKFSQTKNYGDLVPRDKLEFVEGVGVNPYDPANANRAIPNPNKPFTMDATGKAIPNTQYQQYELQKAAAGAHRTNVSVDSGPKAFWSDFGKSASDALFQERANAQSAAATLQNISQIRDAVKGGVYQGTGANMKLDAAKALGALGMPYDSKTVANSEIFNSTTNQFVLEKIKTLGTNPSNADREFIEKTVPRLSMDPKALPALLSFIETKAQQQVGTFNQKMKAVQSQAGAQFMPFSLEVPTNQQPQSKVVDFGSLK